MASKRIIKRIALAAIWTLVTGGMVTLLIAANGRQQEQRCADVRIKVKGTGERYYISKSDIAFLLAANGEPTLVGVDLGRIDLARLERRLEGQSWIQDAELFFDRANVLHVTVTERQPIARVFATNGSSFYIDSSGAKLPLLHNISARVPVITNYPSATRPLPKDSAVISQVRHLVQYINGHDFWSAQLAQVDITPVGHFELLPTVGNHTIRIGNADSLEKKLHRLMLFYKQVLSKAGFDKYGVVDVQFDGQVVATQPGGQASIDSAALKRNIAQLLKADQIMEAHKAAEAIADKNAPATDSLKKTVSTAGTDISGPDDAASKERPAAAAEPKAVIKKPVAEKKATTQQTPKATTPVKAAAKTQAVKPSQKPKAVMQKKT